MGKTLELSAFVNGHWFQSRAGIGHPDKISPLLPPPHSPSSHHLGFQLSMIKREKGWDVKCLFIESLSLPPLKLTTQSSEATSKIIHRARHPLGNAVVSTSVSTDRELPDDVLNVGGDATIIEPSHMK